MNNRLALNMIVGPGEADNLLQCLHTVDAKNFFDEIVLCFTSKDPKESAYYLDVFNDFNPKHCFHEWTSDRYPHGNFAAARNTCIDNTESKYIFWLDCDDRIECSHALFNLKRQVLSSDRDFFMIGYLIDKLDDGRFLRRFMKERIFRNRKDIRWLYPVHEQLDLKKAEFMTTVEGLNIEHHSIKESPLESIERNLKILEHEIQVEPCRHVYLFHANELMAKYTNTKDPAILKQSLDEMDLCIKRRYGSSDSLAVLCYTIAMYHIPLYIKEEDFNIQHDKNLTIGEIYANLSISFSNKYAEPHFILGEIFLRKGDERRAVFHYKEALKKKLDGLGYQSLAFYEEYPSRRLMEIFGRMNDPELSLWYSKRVLLHAPKDNSIHDLRIEILSYLLDKEKKYNADSCSN